MILENDEMLKMFVEESQEHLSDIEDDLLKIESAGEAIDSDLVNKVFRSIHSIKGGAGFFGLEKIKMLGHDMENVLNMVRNRKLIPTMEIVNALLDGADLLNEMVNHAVNSNDVDITEPLTALQAIVNHKPVIQQPDMAETGMVEDGNLKTNEISEVAIETPSIFQPANLDHLHLPFVVDAQIIEKAKSQYEHFYCIRYDLVKDIQEQGRSLREVHRELQQTGAVLGASLNMDADIFPEDTRECILLFATVLEPDFVATLTDVAEGQIQQVSLSPLEPSEANYQPALAEDLSDTEHPPSDSPFPPVLQPDSKIQVPVAPSKPAPPQSLSNRNKNEPETPVGIATPATESTLRVNVKLLDQLMNLAGELVLTRNQLTQMISSKNLSNIDNASQRLNLITSELQETIMSTRMQPVGIVFSKFRRIVRDMSRTLDKNIELVLEGEEVELDKTIIEALSDPLTHLVRNGIDHGIEKPAERTRAGKPEQATLKLCAFHEAGQVIIEISDDGRGIDPVKIKSKALEMGLHDRQTLEAMSDKDIIRLIFAPGFSTAKEVTDISGRGVGMDVVNTKLTHLGGVVDLDSTVGVATTVRIKLPLTLAIIPSLVILVGNERYAIPQVNVSELVRVSPAQVKERIQKIGGALVLRLRGDLLPLVRLSELVGMGSFYCNPETGRLDPDRRKGLHDRRQHKKEPDKTNRRKVKDRRTSVQSAISIVVVTSGSFQYGLVVDQLLDSEEIVVKPLDRHLKECKIYAGATIQGDGRVAMILDIVEIGKRMDLTAVEDIRAQLDQQNQIRQGSQTDAQSLVLVKNAATEQFAVPLGLVTRIERIDKKQIETAGGRPAMKYRGGSLMLLSIEDVANVKPRENTDQLFVIIFSVGSREVGLLVSQLVDAIDTTIAVDQITFRQPGILGSAIINDTTTLIVDLFGIVETIVPEWLTKTKPEETHINSQKSILIAEDSKFFLSQMISFVEEAGYKALTAEDGHLALQVLEQHAGKIDLVLTDIEMPKMNGLALTQAIRHDQRFQNLPVIAVTSVAGETAEKRGKDAGIDSYLIKLDREQILTTIAHYLKNGR